MNEEVAGGDVDGFEAVSIGDADYADWEGVWMGCSAEEGEGDVEGADEGFGGLSQEGVEEGGRVEGGGWSEEA